jgi:hypothetical protein
MGDGSLRERRSRSDRMTVSGPPQTREELTAQADRVREGLAGVVQKLARYRHPFHMQDPLSVRLAAFGAAATVAARDLTTGSADAARGDRANGSANVTAGTSSALTLGIEPRPSVMKQKIDDDQNRNGNA